MRLFFRLLWPRSRRSLYAWTPLIVVGAISCLGLSLALGLRSGVLAQHDAGVLRDGCHCEPPTKTPAEGPLRSSRLYATGYGPLVVTVFAGKEGQRLDIPGIPQIEASGTVLASPAVLAQIKDDWTGELYAWLGGRKARALSDAALTHPREMVIIDFIDTVPPDIGSQFHPVGTGPPGWAKDTSVVVMGLLILVLPSVALARSGATVHLNTRARRFGLLRILGTPPRQLALAIAADMAVPMLAGAILGSVVYAAVMSSLGSFTLAGSSYWTKDLVLPVAFGASLPLVTLVVGLSSVARTVHRASRDPLGTLRRARGRASYLTYLSAACLPAGAIALFMGAKADYSASIWLMTGGLLLSIVGLEGLSRLAVTVSGRAIVDRTRAQIAGSRMSRSGADALLGVSGTAVAVLLVVFVTYASFDRTPPIVGTFDIVAKIQDESRGSIISSVIAELGSSASPESIRSKIAAAMEERAQSEEGDWHEAVMSKVAGYDGVTRVVYVGRFAGSVYTMTCDEVPGSVELDMPCASGSIYVQRPTEEADMLVGGPSGTPGSIMSDPTEAIAGIYPVGGRVTASWMTSDRGSLLIVDSQPASEFGVLLVSTDGARESMRQVMLGLRDLPGTDSMTTRAALASEITDDTLIYNPYLLVMATMAAAMGAVALLYAVLLLFRQRQAEFRMLRCQGATRMLLAVDLGVLFAVPLILAFGLAIASGLGLAATYNAAFGVSTPQDVTQVVPVLATMLSVGMAATLLVAVWATRMPPLVTDPDAAAA